MLLQHKRISLSTEVAEQRPPCLTIFTIGLFSLVDPSLTTTQSLQNLGQNWGLDVMRPDWCLKREKATKNKLKKQRKKGRLTNTSAVIFSPLLNLIAVKNNRSTKRGTFPSIRQPSALTKLRRVQNAGARFLYLAPRYCHITPIIYKLHWLPVTFRIEYKIIINTHKAIPCTSPDYSSSLVNFKPNSSYNLRSNNKYLLSNPNFTTLPTLGDRAFVAAAPNLWNDHPLDLRCTSDFKVFKRNLKTHLFKKAFSDIVL